MMKQIFLILSVILFFGFSSQQTIVGKWENSENLIDATPGEIKIVLKKDGTGDLILDKDRYFWIADKFLYRIMGNRIEVVFVYENGTKTKPAQVDIITLTSREMVLGFKAADVKLVFRKSKDEPSRGKY